MNIEELEKRLEKNTEMIMNNISKIEKNSKNIQKNSIAFEILKDYKKSNKRLYFVLILMLVLWIITLISFHIG